MDKKEYQKRLQEEIDSLKEQYNKLPENDYVERGSVLGKINGLLTAKILSYELGN